AGTEQFAEEVPAEEALRAVNEEFGPRFAEGEGSTQLIQSSTNVLSKEEVLRMLRALHRLEEAEGLRVSTTASAASIVATTLDPSATTLEAQIWVVERATNGEVERAVREAAATNSRFVGLLSSDFNREEAAASATIGVVTHAIPVELDQGAGTGGSSPLTGIQLRAKYLVSTVDGDIRVFGTGIFSDEFSNVIVDTMIIVVPAAVMFIVLFLIVAYRDLVDLLLGVIALAMSLIWTFGFMGLVGLPFNQILIAVPPLLLAVGIDFGIHAVNRYREERVQGYGIDDSIANMTDQIVVAFFIVTVTTVIGFLSNVTSALVPIRDFGVVASVGIVFTFLLFGGFLPATKVYVDRLREQYPIPTFSQTPLGSEGSRLGTALTGGVVIARRAPVVFLLLVFLVSGASAAYATGIDTSFSQEDFLPPEETPAYLSALPEPFAPSEYTVVRDLNFLEEKFESAQDDTVT
ncbi:MAG: MMPL family transporter, partial [Halobacteriales archaeon]|nr:MMPL family transporter [Halobacteriales archaeon]